MDRTVMLLVLLLPCAVVADDQHVGPYGASPFLGVPSPQLSVDADGNRQIAYSFGDVQVVKVLNEAGVTLTRLTNGREDVALVFSGDVYRVERDGRSAEVAVTPELTTDDLRPLREVLEDSPLVRQYKVFLERARTAKVVKPTAVTLGATADLVVLELIAGNVDRANRLIEATAPPWRDPEPQLELVRWRSAQLKDCVGEYTRALNNAWNQLTSCLRESNNSRTRAQRAALRIGCQAAWGLRSQSYIFQFLACSAWPVR